MKLFLRDRLLARRPVLLSKAEYFADWNREHNVWAPIDTEQFVCDACRGLAVCQGFRCETCSDTGYVPVKHVARAFRAYHAMTSFILSTCSEKEKRFNRFLQAAAPEDLELVASLLGAPIPKDPPQPEQAAPKKPEAKKPESKKSPGKKPGQKKLSTK